MDRNRTTNPGVAYTPGDSGNLQMITVRLHVDNSGNLWLLARCRACSNVHKYPAAEVSARPVNCKTCNTEMHLSGAIMEGNDSDTKSFGA